MNESINTCKNCGCIIEGDPAIHDGQTYCPDCIEALGLVQCDDCGEWFDPDTEDMIEYDGKTLCESCRDRRSLVQCDECGEWHRPNDITHVYGNWRISDVDVCDDCLQSLMGDEQVFFCEDCNDYYLSRANDYYTTHDGMTICEGCRNDHWVYCDGCEELYYVDDAVWNDNDDCYYCECCAEDHRSCVHDYSFKPRAVFHGIGKYGRPSYGDPITIGFELEVDDGDSESACASEIMDNFDEDTLYLKHDSSVTFEIVTHPHTLKAYREEFDLKKLCEIPQKHGFSSHNCGTCGLHMHVGRDQLGATVADREITIAKIALLMYRHWPSLVKFSRRRESDLSRWANRPDFSFNPRIKYTEDKLCELVRSYYSCRGRYQALNLENRGTIEFRLWRGSLKPETVDATLQLTSNIVMYAMSHTFEDVAKSVWTDLTQYEVCENLDRYLEERGLVLGEEPFDVPYNNEVTPEPGRTNLNPDGAKFRIGDRVRFNGNRDDFYISALASGHTGTVVYIDQGAGSAYGDCFRYAVHLDDYFSGAHDCSGRVADGHGYYGLDQHLDLVEEAANVGGFHVGDRVRFLSDSAVHGHTGTVLGFEENGEAIAVEVDGISSGHDCGGICPIGTGWWCFSENLEHVSDAEVSGYREGDRVLLRFGSHLIPGVVRAIECGMIGVCTDDFNPGLHDLGGLCEDGHGWWAFPGILEHAA